MRVLRRTPALARAPIALLCSFLLPLAVGCGGDSPTKPSGGGGGSGGPLTFTTFQAASLVLGQPDFSSNSANAGAGSVNATGMAVPMGRIAAGADVLYVAESSNHRVLGFMPRPASNGPAAAFALGQPDLTTNAIGAGASGLTSPRSCFISEGRLLVADATNNRVLIWNSLPTTSGAPADVVVGQPDMNTTTFGASQTKMHMPQDVIVAGGRLIVADALNNRVLIWNTVPTSNGAPADVVVGQADFTSNTIGTSATRLNFPWSVLVVGTRLFVADSGNNRILVFNTIPTANNAAADYVIGQPDMTTGSYAGTSISSVNPRGLASDGVNLFVADAFGNRVLVFSPIPTATGALPSVVLGQTNFDLGASNDADQDGIDGGGITPRTFDGPEGVSVIGRQLFVTDSLNHRVLVFDSTS